MDKENRGENTEEEKRGDGEIVVIYIIDASSISKKGFCFGAGAIAQE